MFDFLQIIVRAVAKRAFSGPLAGAQEDFACLRRFPALGNEVSVFVRPIAEGLILRAATAAPPVHFAFFDVDGDRLGATNFWICH